MNTQTEQQTIHFFPSKVRRALFGLDTFGAIQEGFYIQKKKYPWRNSKRKQLNYTLGFSMEGRNIQIAINKDTFEALKKESKMNFEKMKPEVVPTDKMIETEKY